MDYRQAEQALLLGVLDALPCPTVLLNRQAQTVYVSAKSCPVSLEQVDFSALEDVRKALDGPVSHVSRTELRDGEGAAVFGILELYPVNTDDGLLGLLCLFRPEPVWDGQSIAALPTVSEAMRHVWERLHTLAGLGTAALILGEKGLGCLEFARLLHENSARRSEPFHVLTAEDSPARLQDLAASCEGSVCCDRIDRWDGALLSEAVTIFTARHVVRGMDVRPLKARLIAVAGPDLPERAKEGMFPAELFARMNIMPLFIPPLRQRPEDILPAAEKLAASYAALQNKDIQGFGEEARSVLVRQEWRENYTALRQMAEDAVTACPGGLIPAEALGGMYSPAEGDLSPLRRLRNAYGRDHVRAMLDIYGYGVEGKRKAAAELGISLSTLYRIIGSGTDGK